MYKECVGATLGPEGSEAQDGDRIGREICPLSWLFPQTCILVLPVQMAKGYLDSCEATGDLISDLESLEVRSFGPSPRP